MQAGARFYLPAAERSAPACRGARRAGRLGERPKPGRRTDSEGPEPFRLGKTPPARPGQT